LLTSHKNANLAEGKAGRGKAFLIKIRVRGEGRETCKKKKPKVYGWRKWHREKDNA